MGTFDTEETVRVIGDALRKTKGLDRRAFIAALGATAAGSAFLGTFAAPKAAMAADENVNLMTWAGPWRAALDKVVATPLASEKGIKVNYIGGYDFPKLMAMFQAKDYQVDVILPSGLDTPRLLRREMNAELDFNIIDKSQLTPNQLKNKGIGAVALSTLLVYSKNKWPGEDHPNSWADFWNVEKYPGNRSMYRNVAGMLEAALLADGVKAEEMYPLDVERGFRKLDEIKPHIRTWWRIGTDIQQMMQDGEIDISPMWNGSACNTIYINKANLGLIWNGAILDAETDAWFVLKNSPNQATGMKYLDFVGRPEVQAGIARLTYYSPQNKKAFELLSEQEASLLPTFPDNEKVSMPIDYWWWADNYDTLSRRFESWVQA